jgi:hypothetical protein
MRDEIDARIERFQWACVADGITWARSREILSAIRAGGYELIPSDGHADDCGIRTRGICDCGNWEAHMGRARRGR